MLFSKIVIHLLFILIQIPAFCSELLLPQNDITKIDLQSENCITSVYDEDFLYVGCKNQVAVVDTIHGKTIYPVLYDPLCTETSPFCENNQILAMSPLKKNVLVCFSEQKRTFVCTRFRKASTVDNDLEIDPMDESFEFRAPFINPTTYSPTLFDKRRNLFIAGFLGTLFPEIMKLNLDESSGYTAALKIDRGLHNRPHEIISEFSEFVDIVQIGDFVYVFFNEVYEENKSERPELRNKTKFPNDGRHRARVLRLCSNDQPAELNMKLWSYFVKAPLSCAESGSLYSKLTSVVYDEYSKLIFASFTTNDSRIKGSVLCTYSVDLIDDQFGKNLFQWKFPDGLVSVDNPNPNFKCSQEDKENWPMEFKFTVQDSISASGSQFVEQFSIEKLAVKTYVNTSTRKMRSITFGVTKDGYLIRHHFLDAQNICQLEPIRFEQSDSQKKIVSLHLIPNRWLNNQDQLTVVFEKEALIVPVQVCSNYLTQRSCLAAQDPFCFWEDSLWSESQISKCTTATDSTLGESAYQCPYELVPADYSDWSENYACAHGCSCKHRFCMTSKSKVMDVQVCPNGPIKLDVSRCPVDGAWGAWSAWTDCVDNQRTKERRCNNPEPKNGGKDCVGAKIIYEKCEQEKDKVVSPILSTKVSDWSRWMVSWVDPERNRWQESRLRVRYTDAVTAENQQHFKFESSHRNCSLLIADTCPQSSLMVSLLSSWTEWSPCSSACGQGKRIRKRKVCTGFVCNKDEMETQSCKESECPQPTADPTDLLCWSEWTPCSSKCGSGIRTRQRICPSDDYFNCLQGKQTDNEDCVGTDQCGTEGELMLVGTCHLELVEKYRCIGPSCNQQQVLKPCSSELNGSLAMDVAMMATSPNQRANLSDFKFIILTVTITAIIVSILLCTSLVVIQKCLRRKRTGDEMPEKYNPIDPMIDLAASATRGYNPQDSLGIYSDSFHMTSSNLLPQMWNKEQPLATFNDSDQPINNGYFSVDYSYSKRRKQELQETASYNLYRTLGHKRSTGQPFRKNSSPFMPSMGEF